MGRRGPDHFAHGKAGDRVPEVRSEVGQWNENVFQWAHLYLWQALIMLDVLVVWLLWVRTLPRAHASAHA